MTHSQIKFLRSVGIMVGAIIGVGVFGLPYAFSQVGLAVGLSELFAMGILLTILQLMQAEVVVQTEERHRLAGYVREYLGKGWSRITLIAMAAGVWGAMIAYMIVGGKFLFFLASPIFGGTEFAYSLILAGIASALIYRGLAFASRVEVGIVCALLFLFIFMILAGLSNIDPAVYLVSKPENFFLPYGVIFFSLSGIGIVPEMRDVLGQRLQSRLGQAIIIGMSIIVFLYAAFATVVYGVTGSSTTQIAFDGLVPVLGATFGVSAALLGTLTIVSIYFILGIELLNTLKFDFLIKHKRAWALVVFVPVAIFLFGAREFIGVIGFVGAVFSGALGIIIALTYARLKQSKICREHKCVNFPHVLTWILILLFVGGIVYEIMSI
ncbi:hypothetical protein HY771_02340 [Candidatus Uhrbacteria bacterium]|nr:hypothetical protein [Candidatus Uhrbacteria bacterium]